MNEASMFYYRVYCNQSLIASFPTEHQRIAFIAERSKRFPANRYGNNPA